MQSTGPTDFSLEVYKYMRVFWYLADEVWSRCPKLSKNLCCKWNLTTTSQSSDFVYTDEVVTSISLSSESKNESFNCVSVLNPSHNIKSKHPDLLHY